MADHKIKELAQHILTSVETVSPYYRGSKEHRIYVAGWLSAHLATILQGDRRALREFEDKIRSQLKGPAARD